MLERAFVPPFTTFSMKNVENKFAFNFSVKYHFSQLPHGGPESDRERRDLSFDRYDREEPCIGMKQILTGFEKWSDRYISSCSGQRNHSHQKKRITKWRYI